MSKEEELATGLYKPPRIQDFCVSIQLGELDDSDVIMAWSIYDMSPIYTVSSQREAMKIVLPFCKI